MIREIEEHIKAVVNEDKAYKDIKDIELGNQSKMSASQFRKLVVNIGLVT
eukprot:CAMPEP_0116877350 /NCGR_PEP_ID=MMETSP0463-20121206/9139_1 /TAXON_ID=181622 /ORGANISM="Strombidinopsis sp, Strain SopsisLIS2011" /LENGTH=49 /DNA_ID=CAMNT_0004524561 /DNA_START=1489 /DNA_END=1638 /DNA_ORIENTATION=-